MPWCPKCRCDFEEGVRICSDCGSELVDELDLTEKERMRVLLGKPLGNKNEEKPKVVEMHTRSVDEVMLANISDRIEMVYITSLLEQADIAFRVAEEDIGQYMSIVQGRSYMGSCIYVSREDYGRALQVLESLETVLDDAAVPEVDKPFELRTDETAEQEKPFARELEEDEEEVRPYRGSVIGKRIVQCFLAFGLLLFVAALIIGLLLG